MLLSEERGEEDAAEAAAEAEADAVAEAEAAAAAAEGAEGGSEGRAGESTRAEGMAEEGWGEEDADERAALESAIGKILEWQEQVVRENQQAAELLPLRAQLELARAPARARTRELQCGDSD